DFLDLHLQQRARVGVERRLPQLLGVHLAEALVALEREAFAAGAGDRLEQADRAMNRRLLVLAPQRRGWGWSRISLLQGKRELVELACVRRAEQGLVDDCDLLDPADHSLELETVLAESSGPAALGFIGQRVKASGDVFGRPGGGCRLIGYPLLQNPGNRG